MMPTKKQRRTAWMETLNSRLIALRPDAAGKVDWDTASYFFLMRVAPAAAADRMAAMLLKKDKS